MLKAPLLQALGGLEQDHLGGWRGASEDQEPAHDAAHFTLFLWTTLSGPCHESN
jgi:hypothetical protein